MRVVVPVQQPPPPPPDPAPPRVHELRPREPQPGRSWPPHPRPRRFPAAVAAGWRPPLWAQFVVAAVARRLPDPRAARERQARASQGASTRTVAAHLSTGSSGAAPITKGVEGSAHSVVAKPAQADLRVAAHGSGSWLEIRRGSATGPILYSATLTDGQTLHFRAPKLWGRFGAASNLTITANAHPVRIQGTYEKLFVAPR